MQIQSTTTTWDPVFIFLVFKRVIGYPVFKHAQKKPIECVTIELNSKSITQVTQHEKPQNRQDIHHQHQGGKGQVSSGACK